jgi:GTPase SAR1 family protein
MKKYVIKSNHILFFNYFIVIVLGEVSVGKTNIIKRLIGQEFKDFEATVGVDFSEYLIKNVDEKDPEVCLSVQIWDTCNKFFILFISRSRKIQSNYFKVKK